MLSAPSTIEQGAAESYGSRLLSEVANMARHSPQVMQQFLARLLTRSALTDEEQQAVLDLPASVQRVPANCDFVGLGEHLDHACLVVDGLVARFEQTSKGDRQITALHVEGDMADLHSVVLPKTSWGLHALTPSRIAQIPHGALVVAANLYPALARAFWRDCAVDASIIANWSVSLGRRNAKARLAHLLCELKCREEAVGRYQQDGFGLPMTQVQLADVLGLTAVHINRMIGTLRSASLITMYGNRVTILNWPGLVQAADFDPAYLHLERQPEPIVH
jgi:CRP-like cAMP-binding protein